MSGTKVLIVSLGSIGQRHARNLSSLYDNLELIAFRSKKNKRETGLNIKEYYDLKEALKEKPLAAIISNPTSLHISTALELAEAGVNLFIEKPISNNLDGIEPLQRVIKEKNLTVMVGYCLRFHPLLKKIHAMVTKGALGKILFARVQAGQYLPDWHPEMDHKNSYSAKNSLGGGVILDLSHELDYTQWLFGDVKEVTASIGKISDLEIETEDYAEILLTFNEQVRAEVHLDYLQRFPTRTGLIVGEKAAISFDINNSRMELYSKRRRVEISQPYDIDQMYKDEIKHFMTCVRKKTTPLISLEEGLKSLKIALAAKQSSLEGKRISLEK